ncbi:hypothetical protein ASPCADRAFT_128031 [Aspergillus carbonarius ITEM 5010]|uniref:Cytochrome P450 n=1 Tax=Aspergillus carbonarius (strain ITEM 5010) TaxID=602072 RepID=A0A1R3RTQ9_ASPC5|nr:hypothetical protein ASPCADRAFT_128031 [Aspergillus carbonarius ITEM 5010]
MASSHRTVAAWSSLVNPIQRILDCLLKLWVRQIGAWLYLFNGPRIIQRKFNKSQGRPFEIFTPDNRYVFASSPQHIRELDTAPDTVHSLQAASRQMLQPRYTMHGFNWFDRRGTEGVGFVRALRTLLPNNLPQILPSLAVLIRSSFAELHSKHALVNATHEAFMASALSYIEETLICAELLRLSPTLLGPLVGAFISRRLRSHEIIYAILLPIAEQRCLERDRKNLGHDEDSKQAESAGTRQCRREIPGILVLLAPRQWPELWA